MPLSLTACTAFESEPNYDPRDISYHIEKVNKVPGLVGYFWKPIGGPDGALKHTGFASPAIISVT